MLARAGTGLGAPLVDRHIAIVDPLLIHPFPAQPLLSGQRMWGHWRTSRGTAWRFLTRCRHGKEEDDEWDPSRWISVDIVHGAV